MPERAGANGRLMTSKDRTGLAIHLDLVGGLAGDMFVAALVDALPALQAPVLTALAAMRPPDSVLPVFDTQQCAGLRARRFGLPKGYRHASKQGTLAVGANAEHGTSAREIHARLTAAPLTPATRAHALALLAVLTDAEAQVHGTPRDAVHFHELADWDSVMDLVAAGCIAAELEHATWSASAPPLGNGRVRTAHGMLPVPTPATVALLAGYPWHDDGVGGERVTPTGAAILRHLVPPERCGTARVTGRLVAIGSGAGTRTLPGLPNIARALVFEAVARPLAADIDGDTVAVMECDVDDMTGEEIALAADRLRARADVLDVTLDTRMGKKGRPVTGMRILALPAAVQDVAQACFGETSTLGLRVREEHRHVLRRTDVLAHADGREVTVKLARRPGGEVTGKAAHDDVASGATLESRRATRARAVDRACGAREEGARGVDEAHDGGAGSAPSSDASTSARRQPAAAAAPAVPAGEQR